MHHPIRLRGTAREALLALALATLPVATPLTIVRAQSAAPAAAKPHRETFTTKRDWAVAGGILAGSALLSIWDKEIYGWFQDSSRQDSPFLRHRVREFNFLQETYLTVGGLAVYGIGRLSKSPSTADIGFHVAEAVFTASLFSQVIRGPLGRSRPTTNGGTDQYDFHFFKGFGEFDYRAFPSIHSSSGFAAATVVTREVAQRWPRQKAWVGPVAYGLALTPGLSRLYLGQHWASDIVMGAAIGTIVGQRIVTYNHRNPNNRANRLFLGKSEVGEPPAMRVGVSFEF